MHSGQEQIVDSERLVFLQQNFRDGMSEFQMQDYGIPHRGMRFKKEEVLPQHLDQIKDYVVSFTVGEERKNPLGMLMLGSQELCLKYMSLILRRVYMRRRSIYCSTVYDLEVLCRDREQFEHLGSQITLLGVHSFPFFHHGILRDKPDAMMTPFHQLLHKRINNSLPTILVCHTDLMSLVNQYGSFPSYMREDLQNYFLVREFKAA